LIATTGKQASAGGRFSELLNPNAMAFQERFHELVPTFGSNAKLLR
jgi:hypothetical protein